MMSEQERIIYWKDIRKKAMWQDLKWRAKEAPKKVVSGVKNGFHWCEEHPELAVSIIGATVYGCRQVNKFTDRVERNKREKLYYDHSLQQQVKLKRKLSPAEQAYARERHDNGEQYYEIYKSMNVLK